jgi:hypothetical protein
VVQCSSESLHRRFSGDFSNFMADYLNSGRNKNLEGTDVDYKIISPANFKNIFSNVSTSTSKDGISFSNISLNQSFIIDSYRQTSDVSFLSYFVVAYLDRSEILNNDSAAISIGSMDKRILSTCSFGNVSSEVVISQGSVNKNSFAFKSANMGEFWVGAMHRMDDGTYMKYNSHENNPNHRLEMIELDNIKTKDHRVFDKISSLDINVMREKPSPVALSEDQISKTRKDRSLSTIAKKNHGFVSNLMITRDSFNNARFFFSIDVEEMISSVTNFPMLLENLKSTNSSLYKKTINGAKISNFRISRRSLKINKDTDLPFKKASFVEDEQSMIIVETADSKRETNVLKPTLYSIKNPNGEILSITPRKVGSIEQTSIASYGASYKSPIRHFSGSDYDVSSKKSGVYEYVLEIEFSDPTLPLIKGRLKRLSQLIRGTPAIPGIEQYYKDSMNKKAYDSITNQFKGNFMSFYNKKYGSSRRDTNTFQSADKGFVSRAIMFYVNTLYLMCGNYCFSNKNLSQHDVLMYLANISSPNSGSPQGINKFLQLLYVLEDKMEKMISKNSKQIRYRGDGSGETLANNVSIQTSGETRDQKFTHVFEDTYDATTESAVGFEYLLLGKEDTESNISGLSMFSNNQIIQRFKLETQKYFKTPEEDISIVDRNGNKYNPGDNIENTKYSFLSISNVRLLQSDQNIVFSNTNRAIKSPRLEEMNEVLSQVLMYNYSKKTQTNIANKSPDVDNTSYKLIESLNQASVGNSRNLRKRRDSYEKNDVFAIESKKDLIDENELLFADDGVRKLNSNNMQNNYKKTLSLSNFISSCNFLDEKNSTKYYLLNDEDGAVKIKNRMEQTPTIIASAPNQIKSLFLSILNSNRVYDSNIFTAGSNSEETGGSYTINSDAMRDPKYAGYMYFNYKNLRRIEVFQGYAKVGGSITRPIFEPLRKSHLLMSSTSPILCRHVNYESDIYGIKKIDNMNLPTYNEYFLISPKQGDVGGATGSPFILNSYNQGFSHSQTRTSRTIEKKYNSFFNRRGSTTEKNSSSLDDVVRKEYVNSNVVMNADTIYSTGLADKQMQEQMKKNVLALEDESVSNLLKKISQTPIGKSLGITHPGTTNTQMQATPANGVGDSSTTSASAPSTGAGSTGGASTGGSTY